MALSKDKIESLVGDWADLLLPFMSSPKMDEIFARLKEDKATYKIIPDQSVIFRCFKETPLSQVRVVIVGADPYPNAIHAEGLAFSVPAYTQIPASLKQIYSAIEKDAYAGLNLAPMEESRTGDLTYLTKQGVLLFNCALTVREKIPGDDLTGSGSHEAIWGEFARYTIAALQEVKRELIWLLWGKKAQDIASTEINTFTNSHFVFTEEHPSKAGHEKREWKTNHFSRCNAVITANKFGEKIIW
jgi:uracil-DNA glycosylase